MRKLLELANNGTKKEFQKEFNNLSDLEKKSIHKETIAFSLFEKAFKNDEHGDGILEVLKELKVNPFICERGMLPVSLFLRYSVQNYRTNEFPGLKPFKYYVRNFDLNAKNADGSSILDSYLLTHYSHTDKSAYLNELISVGYLNLTNPDKEEKKFISRLIRTSLMDFKLILDLGFDIKTKIYKNQTAFDFLVYFVEHEEVEYDPNDNWEENYYYYDDSHFMFDEEYEEEEEEEVLSPKQVKRMEREERFPNLEIHHEEIELVEEIYNSTNDESVKQFIRKALLKNCLDYLELFNFE